MIVAVSKTHYSINNDDNDKDDNNDQIIMRHFLVNQRHVRGGTFHPHVRVFIHQRRRFPPVGRIFVPTDALFCRSRIHANQSYSGSRDGFHFLLDVSGA